ncbi:MAG: hypothetical protein WC412_08405 [Candidatus Omnitrophota bacterium]|jgi:hypothetical protein
MGRVKYQKILLQILGTRPVAYNPDLARALGSAKAGLFLSQLLYWWGNGRKPGEIYKTIEEIKYETGLSRTEQETAIKICKKFKVLEATVKGIPAKRHFKIGITNLVELMNASMLKTNKLVCEKRAKELAEKKQTITENTTHNTYKEYGYINARNKIFKTFR